jgi:lipoprotein Spr
MNATLNYNKILILTTALLLALLSVSCGVMKQANDDDSGYPTKRGRTSSAVRRTGGNHNRDWAKAKPNDDNLYDDRGVDNGPIATDEEWKKLDIKLGRHDNKRLYNEIKSWLGTPYSGGGHTKQVGTDCSGFVMELYLTVYNISLERRGGLQFYNNCEPIDKSALREGDLVFFNNGDGGKISHVGIYLKDNKFAHASSSRGVVIDDLTAKYYVKHFFAAGRVKR